MTVATPLAEITIIALIKVKNMEEVLEDLEFLEIFAGLSESNQEKILVLAHNLLNQTQAAS